MGKILITADIHNGVPNKFEDTIWSMEIIRKYATSQNIKDVIVAGYLFHDRVSISIPVLNAVYKELKEAAEEGQKWYISIGNHDMFLKTSCHDNSIKILKEINNSHHDIIETTDTRIIQNQKFWFVPFMHYEKDFMESVQNIEDENDVTNDILITHIGVKDSTLNECFLIKHWSIVTFEESKFKRIYTGHFHCNQQVGDKCWYPGSPIPLKIDEGVVDHGFYVYDTDNNSHEFIKIFDICKQFSDYRPPDYITIIDTDIKDNSEMLVGNHVRVVLTNEYTNHELIALKNDLIGKGSKTVSWFIPKKNIEEVETVQHDNNMRTPSSLFKSYIGIDKPKLDVKTLLHINELIITDADTRFVESDEDVDNE